MGDSRQPSDTNLDQCQHTVYEGEGVGTLLGTKLISNKWGIQSANIYIDNQAFITATTLIKPSAGYYIFNAFHNSIMALQKKHRHKNKDQVGSGTQRCRRNEEADEQVKKVIMEGSSITNKLQRTLR